MIDPEETTELQLAVEHRDPDALARLVATHSAGELTEVQIFGNQTLLMYTCELGTTEMVQVLLDKGVEGFELEWSDNNELKSVLRNAEYGDKILPMVLEALPDEILVEMIESDWDPEPHPKSEAESPLGMAQKLECDTCLNLLLQKLEVIRS